MGIEQDMQNYTTQQINMDPLRAALLGGSIGVAGGLAHGALGGLAGLFKKKKPALTDTVQIPLPVEPKIANDLTQPIDTLVPPVQTPEPVAAPKPTPVASDSMFSGLGDKVKQDPYYTTKMVGAFGLPLLGGYGLMRGINNYKKKQKSNDLLDQTKQEYSNALQSYMAAGQKTASGSALDRLAVMSTEKKAILEETSTQVANAYLPLVLGGLGIGGLLGYNKARKADKSKITEDATQDWHRKMLYASPPPIQAIAAPQSAIV